MSQGIFLSFILPTQYTHNNEWGEKSLKSVCVHHDDDNKPAFTETSKTNAQLHSQIHTYSCLLYLLWRWKAEKYQNNNFQTFRLSKGERSASGVGETEREQELIDVTVCGRF